MMSKSDDVDLPALAFVHLRDQASAAMIAAELSTWSSRRSVGGAVGSPVIAASPVPAWMT